MRYGTRTESKRRWSRQGRRPQCKVKLGYEWGYLYLAVAPFTGDMLACFATHLNKDCFSYFGEVFWKHIQKEQTQVVLIGEGTSAHQPKVLPENVAWVKLPTACPELNLAERVFKELRKVLANRVFLNVSPH